MSFLSNSAKKREYKIFNILCIFLLCLLLTVVPIPNIAKWVWPQWLLVFVIYKVISEPQKFGIFFGFMIGLTLDLLLGNKLGIHALSFSLISYFLLKVQQRVHLYPGIQLFLLVFLVILLDFILVILFTPSYINWIFFGQSILLAMSTAITWAIVTSVFKAKYRF